MEPILKARNLVKRFGKVTALNGMPISISIRARSWP